MTSKLGIVLTAAFVSLVAARGAGADECASARQHLVIARRALQVHDYQRAVAEYQRSYEEDGDSTTLILLARAYEQLGQTATASDLYRSYLEQRIEIFDDRDAAAFRTLPLVDDIVARRAREESNLRPRLRRPLLYPTELRAQTTAE